MERYNSNGSLDTSFGDGGSVQISEESNNADLAIQSDGKILVSLDDDIGSNPSVLIKHFEANGSLDPSWGVNGSVTTPVTLGNYGLDTYPSSALQLDGKILVAGSSGLARYNPNGALDRTLTTIENILDLTVQDNGKIVVLNEDGLSRFNSDLTPDNTFGNGTVIPSPVGALERRNLILQGDGRIVVAGDVNGSLSLTRYQGDVFDAAQYGASHTDLIAGIGYNLDALTQHYQNSGRSEGRQQDLFNEFRYLASHPDLLMAYGANGAAATEHYIRFGYFENRSLTAFDAARYLLSYEDLEETLSPDLEAASRHYVTSGRAEGRDPNLFASDRYIASHPDLLRAFRYNLEEGSKHYLFSGRGEGRPITFSPEAYLSRYGDLQAALGNDLVAATYHYITTGFDEGRSVG
jgi:serralysin